jgi:tRNA pseudouridine55 synthase
MDGLLIVDKPSGPTSHDVVARARRILGERRIGHTGTLDPMATGVLPLVVGRATRLARFISDEKTYEAVIRLGVETDTCDAMGTVVGAAFGGPWPDRSAIECALDAFRGTFLQQAPAFSAKKIDGRRSYDLARRGRVGREGQVGQVGPEIALPAPAQVTVHSLVLGDVTGDLVRLRVHSSAGFYVRSLAHDLGAALRTGAHLIELRRIEAAGFGIEQALRLDTLDGEGGREAADAAIVPMAHMLPRLPAVALTDDGVAHVRCGRDLGPADAVRGFADAIRACADAVVRHVRLTDRSGQLVAMAEATRCCGLLHPAVVLL